MKPKYLPQEFEEKWIDVWEKEQTYATPDIEKELPEDTSVSDLLRKTQKHARGYYFDVLKKWDGYVPALQKRISISKLGWEHIIGKSRHTKDKLYRFFVFPLIIPLLQSAELKVRHTKGRNTAWNTEFWECSGVVDGIRLEVIITLTERKEMELFSVIWKGLEKVKPQKKELSRALKRHVQGMVTLQLHTYYATFVRECQAHRKQYILDMFPYPSGAGLHVGHVEGYTATDIYSRYMRMNGKDVLHPIGWDAFGLPAENYAIKTGVHPKKSTDEAIINFITQIKRAGLSYDWKREIGSHREDYYKWTQWLFLFLYKKGLAYRKEAYVNWDPVDQTVLANEQVLADGTAERSGAVVEQKLLTQWFFKITDYADRLIDDLDKVDWPESTKAGQRNWIGKSEGALVKFEIRNPKSQTDLFGGQALDVGAGSEPARTESSSSSHSRTGHQNKSQVEVFTTRHDTVFGVTFLVLAPDHPLVEKITTAEQKKAVDAYVTKTKQKTELQRQQDEKEKTGVFTGAYAVNPFTKEEIPIWIADYVLMSYGTGAVMAVPAHDERDFAFAKKYGLEIRPVVQPETSIYTVIERSLPEEKVKKLSSFGKVHVIKQVEAWGKIFSVEIPIEKEAQFMSFLEKNLVDKSGDGGWYADSMGSSNVVVFPQKSITIRSSTDLEKFKEHGRKIGIPEDQLDIDIRCIQGTGITVNSGFINGLSTKQAKENVIEYIEKEQIGQRKITYKLRDWLISRQRFWGAPIPIVYRKNDYDSILLDFFREVRSIAKNYFFSYLKGQKMYISSLKDHVSITYVSWEHIAMKTRSKEDTLYRLFFLPYILEMLQREDIDIRYAKGKKDHSEFWECTVVIFDIRFQVILRSYNKGKKHLYSLICKGEVKKPKKMELSRACIPRSWGIYTPQLHNYFTLFINKCQEKVIEPGKNKKSTVSCLYPQSQASLEQVKIAFSAYSKYIEKVTDNQDGDGVYEETPIPVRVEDLPVVLPMDAEFKPTGQSPLTDNADFQRVDKKKYPGAVRREADTMDTFVDSSWYFLRFCDPHNHKEFASKKAMNTWGPVDLYMGGAEHTVLHLLYARFFTKVLYDEGYLTFDEPFLKLRHQGIILGPDHRKMSKRWGNVINPLDVCNEYGADTLRMYEMFMGPIDAMKPWNVKSVQGPYRFLTRVWKLYSKLRITNYELREEDKYEIRNTKYERRDHQITEAPNHQDLGGESNKKTNVELRSKLHKTIKKVTEDIQELKFNTAIAAMMEFVNEWEKAVAGNDQIIKAPNLAYRQAGDQNDETITVNSHIIQKETLNEADRLGKDFYFKVLRKWKGYVPSLGETIVITRSGWQHLFEMQRSSSDKLYRYFALPMIIPLLECKDIKPKYTKGKKDNYEFWEYTGIVEDVLVQVVLRSVRGGKKHFYSVIWKGNISEDKKKELSIACIPRVQGNYSLQLHHYYRTYVTKSQIIEKKNDPAPVLSIENAKKFLQILAPFAPFMTEEIWRNGYGEKQSIHLSPWPKYDESLIVEETINLPVQVNGKMRGTLVITQEEAEDQEAIVKKAREDEKMAKHIPSEPRKIIYVKGRILNVIVSS